MEFEWDDDKSAINLERHDVAFEAVRRFNWGRALLTDRSRHADGEPRFAAIGLLNGKLHTVIYTWRGSRRRIISLRRSNKVEEKAYEENRSR